MLQRNRSVFRVDHMTGLREREREREREGERERERGRERESIKFQSRQWTMTIDDERGPT